MVDSHQKIKVFWQKIHKLLIYLIILIMVAVGLFFFLRVNHACDWTGLGECTVTTQTNQIFRPSKTLWDWLNLLIVPAVLAISSILINSSIQKAERQRIANQTKLERQIAEDQIRENALETYLDKMSILLMERNLRSSAENDESRAVARARTLTILRRLDGNKRSIVLRFLKESNLINSSDVILDLQGAQFDECSLEMIDLEGCCIEGSSFKKAFLKQCLLSNSNLSDVDFSYADLSQVDFRKSLLFRANLTGANLTHSDLRDTDLRFTDLHNACLKDANLEGADLNQADISHADLSGATINEEQKIDCRINQ